MDNDYHFSNDGIKGDGEHYIVYMQELLNIKYISCPNTAGSCLQNFA